jgi:hypothetical protein
MHRHASECRHGSARATYDNSERTENQVFAIFYGQRMFRPAKASHITKFRFVFLRVVTTTPLALTAVESAPNSTTPIALTAVETDRRDMPILSSPLAVGRRRNPISTTPLTL